MKKRNLASLSLAALVCMAGCSADTTSGVLSEGANTSAEQSADGDWQNTESSEETSASTEETPNDASAVETTEEETTAVDGPSEEQEDILGLEGGRLYNTRIEVCPECVYSADEWLSEDGKLALPFDENEETAYDDDLNYKFGRYYIPEEALKAASTADLIDMCTDTFFAKSVVAFDRLDFQVQYLANHLNAVDELFSRDDFAEALLLTYQEEELALKASGSDEANARACAVITEELFLARNEVFDQMTDEMREETLSEVMKKQEQIESGEYYYSIYSSSCFFYYIEDLHNDGNSMWYEYLAEKHPEYLEYCDYGGAYYP